MRANEKALNMTLRGGWCVSNSAQYFQVLSCGRKGKIPARSDPRRQPTAARTTASVERVVEVVAATMAVIIINRMKEKLKLPASYDALSFQPRMRAHLPPSRAGTSRPWEDSSASLPEANSGETSTTTDGEDNDTTEIYVADPQPAVTTTTELLEAEEKVCVPE